MDMTHNYMKETRLVAILRDIPKEMLCDVLDAIYEGGVRLAEITYDYTQTVFEEETADMIAMAVAHTKGRMEIGAGTVTRISQVEKTKAAGGKFIISPNTDTDVIRKTKGLGMISMPGAMTISEIVSALEAGADYVKVFPAGVLGAEFIKATLAPIAGARLLAVAGVKPEDVPTYLKAGCVGFGIGGGIASKELCSEGKLDEIRENARKYAEVCRA